MLRKLLMLMVLRMAYRHAHKIISNVENRGARAVTRRKPRAKRRRTGWEF